MIVALDTMVLIYALQEYEPKAKHPSPPHVELQKRAKILLHDLDAAKASVVVPTLVIAEFLTGIEPAKHDQVLAAFQDRFKHLPVFDIKASRKAAELWLSHREIPKKDQIPRRQLKLDTMVIASAWSAGARFFYSHDPKCRKLAVSAGLDARDLPTHSEDLFINAEIMKGKKP